MASVKDKTPRRLKKLEASDLLTLITDSKDTLVVTKQETAVIVSSFIKSECSGILDELKNEISYAAKDIQHNKVELLNEELSRRVNELDKKMTDKLNIIEKSIDGFIEHRFNELSEKICNLLITRRFNDEVNKKAEELLHKKSVGNKF